MHSGIWLQTGRVVMARGKTAPAAAAPLTPLEAKRAAVARVLARRRPPKYATYADPHSDGRVRIQFDGGQGDIAEPATIAEWADDRLARCTPGTPLTDVLVEMFERIRTGGDGAVPGAIDLAAGLDDGGQFAVFMVLNAVSAGPDGISSALLREWKRRALRVVPAASIPVEPTEWSRPSLQAQQVRYRSPLGNPAGMTI